MRLLMLICLFIPIALVSAEEMTKDEKIAKLEKQIKDNQERIGDLEQSLVLCRNRANDLHKIHVVQEYAIIKLSGKEKLSKAEEQCVNKEFPPILKQIEAGRNLVYKDTDMKIKAQIKMLRDRKLLPNITKTQPEEQQ